MGCLDSLDLSRMPCGRAAKELDEAGHRYEHHTVRGGTFKVWTWPKRAADRAEIQRLLDHRGHFSAPFGGSRDDWQPGADGVTSFATVVEGTHN